VFFRAGGAVHHPPRPHGDREHALKTTHLQRFGSSCT
jgi:hypothetical protein